MPPARLEGTVSTAPTIDLGRQQGPEATATLAATLAPNLSAGDVITLEGELGTGKTTFARGLIGALAGPGEVPSPTFTLVQVYDAQPAPLWHFDLYRISAPEEAYELGIEEALADGICLIEWPDRLGALLPDDRLAVQFAYAPEPEARQISLVGHGAWAKPIQSIAKVMLSV